MSTHDEIRKLEKSSESKTSDRKIRHGIKEEKGEG